MKSNIKENKIEELDLTNLYIKGLWKDCTRSELERVFKPYGIVTQSRVYGNGVGFVRFQSFSEALTAITWLNGSRPHERSPQALVVKFAIKKSDDASENKNKNLNQPSAINKNNNIGAITFNSVPGTSIIDASENDRYAVILYNLPSNYSATDIHSVCSKYGPITSINLLDDGIALVKFSNANSPNYCKQDLNGKNPFLLTTQNLVSSCTQSTPNMQILLSLPTESQSKSQTLIQQPNKLQKHFLAQIPIQQSSFCNNNTNTPNSTITNNNLSPNSRNALSVISNRTSPTITTNSTNNILVNNPNMLNLYNIESNLLLNQNNFSPFVSNCLNNNNNNNNTDNGHNAQQFLCAPQQQLSYTLPLPVQSMYNGQQPTTQPFLNPFQINSNLLTSTIPLNSYNTSNNSQFCPTSNLVFNNSNFLYPISFQQS